MTTKAIGSEHWRKRGAAAGKGLVRGRARTLGEEYREGYQAHPGRPMSEAEFAGWVGEKTRAEWVDGEVILMSPVNLEHDRVQGWLFRLLSEFVESRDLGYVRGAEYMVRLAGAKRRYLTDLFFVSEARRGLMKNTYLDGAPDLIVEVVSPDSIARDYREKFMAYEAAGVKEYWTINPMSQAIEASELVRGKYRRLEEKGGIIRSRVLHGLFIRPAWLWHEPLPKLATALRELGVK